MIYVGTNDGMLHGFRNTAGREKFAIIPKSLLGKLKNLNDEPMNSMSMQVPRLTMSTSPANRNGKQCSFQACGGAGPYYFALDVTDPA